MILGAGTKLRNNIYIRRLSLNRFRLPKIRTGKTTDTLILYLRPCYMALFDKYFIPQTHLPFTIFNHCVGIFVAGEELFLFVVQKYIC